MCLRCAGVELIPFGRSSPEIEFFDCPVCHRRYARKPGRSLTYAWLDSVSLPLYSVLFDSDPLTRVSHVAELFVQQKSGDQLRHIVAEIEEELEGPTQRVREILDNPQTEEQCRDYLREFVRCVRARLDAAE
jgi:hypothetical protein